MNAETSTGFEALLKQITTDAPSPCNIQVVFEEVLTCKECTYFAPTATTTTSATTFVAL